MELFFIKLFNMSVSAGWIILAVIALRLLLKKAPRWAVCLLWVVAAVRLSYPLSLESALSLLPSAQTVSPQAVLYGQGPAYGRPQAPLPVIQSGVTVIDRALNPLIRNTLSPNPGDSVNPLRVWSFAAGVVWAAGLTAMLGSALVGYLKMRIRLRESVRLRENIWLCDAVDSPFILGIVRPRIYLPSGAEEAQTDYVLAHEHAHLKRGDHWWKFLGYLLLSVHWFNPLVWAAYTLFCRDLEIACDEKVIRDFDLNERKAYSEALVSCSVKGRKRLVCPLAFGELDVKKRVAAVLRYKRPAVVTAAAAAAVCLLTAVCFLTNPAVPAEAQNSTPAGADAPSAGVGSLPGDSDDYGAPSPAGTVYSAYDALIAEASDALANHKGEYPSDSERKFSSVFWQGRTSWQTLGYLLRDLDGDGADELIFGENGDDSAWDGFIYNIYTISDGKVIRLIDGWERSIYFLCEDGCLAHEWSNSAFEWGIDYYRYENGAFSLVESVLQDGPYPDRPESDSWFYSAESDSGNREDYQAISEERAEEIRDSHVMTRLQFTAF